MFENELETTNRFSNLSQDMLNFSMIYKISGGNTLHWKAWFLLGLNKAFVINVSLFYEAGIMPQTKWLDLQTEGFYGVADVTGQEAKRHLFV